MHKVNGSHWHEASYRKAQVFVRRIFRHKFLDKVRISLVLESRTCRLVLKGFGGSFLIRNPVLIAAPISRWMVSSGWYSVDSIQWTLSHKYWSKATFQLRRFERLSRVLNGSKKVSKGSKWFRSRPAFIYDLTPAMLNFNYQMISFSSRKWRLQAVYRFGQAKFLSRAYTKYTCGIYFNHWSLMYTQA